MLGLCPKTRWEEILMSDACKTCGQSEGCNRESCSTSPEQKHNIKNVIAVMSGKGGVGKSSVTSLLAVALKSKGFSVGIMDADITGPSIPRLFGLKGGRTLESGSRGIMPPKTKLGIEVMSLNLLLPNEDDPVIWRGPVIAGVINQFWNEVEWGDLDYLLVDLPPGTGDVPITVLKNLPLNGVIIVTTPQSLVSMIVKKAVKMAGMMNIPVIGLIDNFAYVECPDCQKTINLFGKDNSEETAAKMGIPLLGRLPMDPKFVEYSDLGQIEDYFTNESAIKQAVGNIARIFD